MKKSSRMAPGHAIKKLTESHDTTATLFRFSFIFYWFISINKSIKERDESKNRALRLSL